MDNAEWLSWTIVRMRIDKSVDRVGMSSAAHAKTSGLVGGYSPPDREGGTPLRDSDGRDPVREVLAILILLIMLALSLKF